MAKAKPVTAAAQAAAVKPPVAEPVEKTSTQADASTGAADTSTAGDAAAPAAPPAAPPAPADPADPAAPADAADAAALQNAGDSKELEGEGDDADGYPKTVCITNGTGMPISEPVSGAYIGPSEAAHVTLHDAEHAEAVANSLHEFATANYLPIDKITATVVATNKEV